MPIVTPSRRPAFPPIGRLRTSPLTGGKKGVMANLNLTAMVDMFTVIVIFLLQSFSATGEIMFIQKDIKLPEAKQAEFLNERGPVVTILPTQILVEGKLMARISELDEADPGIQALADELTAVREREQKLYGVKENEPYDGNVLVQADRKANFMYVRKAIFSVNDAGWIHIQFAVMGLAKDEPTEGAEGEKKE
jgi:biopolymer transport protein ExbD